MLLRLETSGFRNLAAQVWAPGPGTHLLMGLNGAGKTSLLEAVYLLATTRSFRTAQLADCCQDGTDTFTLTGVIERQRRAELSLRFTAGGAGGWRRLVDGHSVSLAAHLSELPILAWSADDASLLGGPPAPRRRLLDRGVVAQRPRALAVLTRYRRALTAKRALLARDADPRSRELAAWNQVLAAEAAHLVPARARYAARLAAALLAIGSASQLDLPALQIDYRPSLAAALDGAQAAERALVDVAPRECAARRALIGPQRDDLAVVWQGRSLRCVASAGERRALGLLFLAAQVRVLTDAHRAPVVLLDDADSELDAARLRQVWALFANVRQLFATSNRPEIWAGVPVDQHWRVAMGAVSRERLEPG